MKSDLQIPSVANVNKGERVKIHNVRFYNLAPRGINCMAISSMLNKLALSRNDNTIEIWDIEHNPVLDTILPKTSDLAIEELIWVGERFFSAGLDGCVVEWDLQMLKALRVHAITGNAIWCAATNSKGSELAVGTEDGYINILDIEYNELQYKQLLDKQDGRVLCCCYDQSGKILATGSINVIRIWDVKTGHAIHKMTLAREKASKDVIVWSLKMLTDFTIVAGDSRGQLTVWDAQNGSQLECHQVLKADILSIAVDETQQQVVCAGVEPIIRIYTRTDINRKEGVLKRWVKCLQRDVHDHDVKALLCYKQRIYSAGVDGYLGVSPLSRAKSNIVKYPPFLLNPTMNLVPSQRLIMLRYNNYLEVWRLGTSSINGQLIEQDADKAKWLGVDTSPEKLLQLRSKSAKTLVCAAISTDGSWLCYSTQDDIRLFRLNIAEQKSPPLTKITELPKEMHCSTHIQFSCDSKRLFLLNSNLLKLSIFSLPIVGEDCIEILDCMQLEVHIKERIKIFSLSECDTYFAVAGVEHSISVWETDHSKEGSRFKHYLNLPRYMAAVTSALTLHNEPTPRILVTFSDGHFFEYDLKSRVFLCRGNVGDLLPEARQYAVISVLGDKRQHDKFFLQTFQHLIVLQKYIKSQNNDESEDKRVKTTDDDYSREIKFDLKLKLHLTYEHYIQLALLNSTELVCLGVHPVSLIEQLPRAFTHKKFGVS